MDEKTERPELGTTEAAVRSYVNLIALATHTDEECLAYWLDLYYQTRISHEGLYVKAIPPSTELTKLDEIDYKIETAVRAVINLVDLIRRGEIAAHSPCAGKAEDARATARVAPTEKIADGLPGGGPEGDKTWAEFREETVEAPQPAARQVPHDIEAEESERPEAAAAQKKTGLR